MLASCGSSGVTAGDDHEEANQVVLELTDLPTHSTVAKKTAVSNKCSPATYFRSYATAVATPRPFVLPGSELLQIVGIFKSDGEARRAFDQITSAAARNCIGAEMHKTALQAVGEPGNMTTEFVPRRLPGETTRAMRLYLAVGLGSVEVERTAILHGRALTTLTFITQFQPLKQAYWKSISDRAAERLDEAVTSIEA